MLWAVPCPPHPTSRSVWPGLQRLAAAPGSGTNLTMLSGRLALVTAQNGAALTACCSHAAAQQPHSNQAFNMLCCVCVCRWGKKGGGAAAAMKPVAAPALPLLGL